jgi:hypothetical protein
MLKFTDAVVNNLKKLLGRKCCDLNGTFSNVCFYKMVIISLADSSEYIGVACVQQDVPTDCNVLKLTFFA